MLRTARSGKGTDRSDRQRRGTGPGTKMSCSKLIWVPLSSTYELYTTYEPWAQTLELDRCTAFLCWRSFMPLHVAYTSLHPSSLFSFTMSHGSGCLDLLGLLAISRLVGPGSGESALRLHYARTQAVNGWQELKA